MEREWAALLAHYGQRVTLHGPGGEKRSALAFLQPILDTTQEQLTPSPLGGRRLDRFLYLGEPGASLSPEDSWIVEWNCQRFAVVSARPVYVCNSLSHWWAMLRPLEKEDTPL